MKTFFAIATITFAALAPANLKIVTTTADLASIASAVGGNKVSVSSLITGARDPHRLEAKPSFMSRCSGADAFIAVGLDLEVGYEQPILEGAGNSRISVGAKGHIYAADYCYVLEKPKGAVTRAQGDIHPYGNPHVWLDPFNGRRIAKGLAVKFGQLDPINAPSYEVNSNVFVDKLDKAMFGAALENKYSGDKLWAWHNEGTLRQHVGQDKIGGWLGEMIDHKGDSIITYHRSLSYLANRFGFNVVEELEPKPGLEPTPSHLAAVVREATANHVKVIMQETFYSQKHAQFVASRTGAKVAVIPLSVGHSPGARDYISLFDEIVKGFCGALDR